MNGYIRASLLLFAFVTIAVPTPIPETAEKSCRDHPRLVGKCFEVRGRLAVYNGTPAVRLWRFGTRRVQGISDQRYKLAGFRNLPESLSQQLNGANEITGEFLVCPFTKPKPREMQLVCIESAKDLSVRNRAR